jgi:hypothetical protein
MDPDWKACDELTPQDFERHPLWGYDVERAENDPASDEAWVRPYMLEAVPEESDLLFARARLRTAAGDVVPGAVLFAFGGGRPRVAGVAFLEPAYFALGLTGNQVTDEDRADLEDVQAGALPLAYEAAVVVGGRELRLAGAAR